MDGVPETCRREFPERNYERCGKRAKYIIWGKLFPPESLGPRCEDCAYDELGGAAMSRIDEYAVYRLPDLAALRKRWEEQLLAALDAEDVHDGDLVHTSVVRAAIDATKGGEG